MMMRLACWSILLLLGFSRAGWSQSRGTPGQFDYYLLTLSWAPEYCHSHPSDTTECASHHFGFVVHGLWPQFTDGSYPENCSNAAGLSNPSSMLDIMPDLGLIQHEWTTHGTCSGLDAQAYFNLIRQAFTSIHMPPQLTSGQMTKTLTAAQIKGYFEQANPNVQDTGIAISCPSNYLSAVEICLSKTLTPMACPAVRSCSSHAVRVPPIQ